MNAHLSGLVMISVVSLLSTACRDAQSEQTDAKAKSSNDREEVRVSADNAESIIERYERLGEQLIATLESEEQTNESRARAARLLRKMRYEPAIPAMIRQLELVDYKDFGSGEFPEGRHCAQGLIEFRDAAIPKLVDAYLTEPDPVGRSVGANGLRRLHLWIVIAPSKKTANVYFQGLAATKDKRITPAKVREWTEYLKD